MVRGSVDEAVLPEGPELFRREVCGVAGGGWVGLGWVLESFSLNPKPLNPKP